MARIDTIIETKKATDVYSDFVTSFELNPFTGSLGRVIDERSVAQSLKNLVLTDRGERFFNNSYGSLIKKALFEPFDDFIKNDLINETKYIIEQNEPRVFVNEIFVTDDGGTNNLKMEIQYKTLNNPEFQTVTISLQRVR